MASAHFTRGELLLLSGRIDPSPMWHLESLRFSVSERERNRGEEKHPQGRKCAQIHNNFLNELPGTPLSEGKDVYCR